MEAGWLAGLLGRPVPIVLGLGFVFLMTLVISSKEAVPPVLSRRQLLLGYIGVFEGCVIAAALSSYVSPEHALALWKVPRENYWSVLVEAFFIRLVLLTYLSLLGTAVIGAPIVMALSRRGMATVPSVLGVSVVISLAITGLVALDATSPTKSFVFVELALYVVALHLLLSLGFCIGAGLQWRVRQRADAIEVAPHIRRFSASAKRALILSVVPILAVGVWAVQTLTKDRSVPTPTKDRSCHNMFRDGRTSISAVAGWDLQIPYNDWPVLVDLLQAFAMKHELAFKNDSEVRPNVRILQVSVCNERGINIDVLEQRWAHLKYESRGVSIGVYVQQNDIDWIPMTQLLIDDLETRWPDKLVFRDDRGRVVPKPQNLQRRSQ